MAPEPISWRKPGKARQKHVADLLKSYATVLTGAALVTPAFSGHGVGGINLAWALVGLYIAAIGFIVSPSED